MPGTYAEDHCALDWQLMTAGVYGPIVAIALFAAALTADVQALNWVAIAIVFLTAAWWASGGGAWLRYVRPVGIRLDSAGVRIGGARRAERGQVRARQAVVPRQYSQVFSCPWSGVLGIGVTTDDDVLRRGRADQASGRTRGGPVPAAAARRCHQGPGGADRSGLSRRRLARVVEVGRAVTKAVWVPEYLAWRYADRRAG